VVDFPGGVQVKALDYDPERWLKGQVSLVEFEDKKHFAPLYVLTLVALPEQQAAVVGWTSGTALSMAPIVDFGYGPRRSIRAIDLYPGIPDIPANR
jgi:hypothetical protein